MCSYYLCSVPSSLSHTFSLTSLMPGTLLWSLRSLWWAVGEVDRDCTQKYAHTSDGILPQGFSPAFQLFHQPCVVCVTLEKFSATQSHMTSGKTFSQKETKIHLVWIHFLSRTEITSRHVKLPDPSTWDAETQIQ